MSKKPRVREINGRLMAVDGIRSLTSGLGMEQHDKGAGAFYQAQYLTYLDLKNTYRSSWVAKKIVDVPAQDALRKWRNWEGEPEQIKKISRLEREMGVKGKLLHAYIQARLWGGAALFIGTSQDKQKPLDPSKITKGGLTYLSVLSRHELSAGELEYDVLHPNYGRPKYYTVANSQEYAEIHYSHLAILRGAEQPDLWGYVAGNALDTIGWGDSILQSTYEAIKNVDSTAANIASLAFEANVDVFGVEDLTENLSDPDYEKLVLDRFALAKLGKSINKSLIHDSSEAYDRKQINFSNLPQLIQQFLLVVAGAADIPLTRFLGQSPGGMNSTGDGDMNNYYDSISAKQELEVEPAIKLLDECIIRSALGSRPEELEFKWTPLKQMTEKEIADIGNITAETAKKLVESGVMAPEAIQTGVVNQLKQSGAFPGIEKAIEENVDFDFGQNENEDDGVPAADMDIRDAAPRFNQSQIVKDGVDRSLYLSRDVLNKSDFMGWAREQGLSIDAESLHVTIAYSKTPANWFALPKQFQENIVIESESMRLIEKFDGGAVVLAFKDSRLERRNRQTLSAGFTTTYPDYQAHITLFWTQDESFDISSIEAYKGEIVLGHEIFQEIKSEFQPVFKK